MKKEPTNNYIKATTENGQLYEIPEEGSLGLLATGYAGLMLWREKRQQLQAERKKKLEKAENN